MCRGIVEGAFSTFEPIGSIYARFNRRTQQRYSSEKRQRAPRGVTAIKKKNDNRRQPITSNKETAGYI